jgi:GxxExxY protein
MGLSRFIANLVRGCWRARIRHALLMSLRSVAFMLAEVPVPVVYDGKKLADVGYRVDLLVENELIVEVKSVEAVAPVHTAQLLSYLRLSKRQLGLLLNFNVVHLRDGIYRRVNRF